MTLTAICHCGAVRVTVPRKPRAVNDCDCSICRRYGALWVYYKTSMVRIEVKRNATESYSWGPKRLRFVRRAHCGCVMWWERVRPAVEAKMGVNARNFDLDVLQSIPKRSSRRGA